jgi:hypothetical protein
MHIISSKLEPTVQTLIVKLHPGILKFSEVPGDKKDHRMITV